MHLEKYVIGLVVGIMIMLAFFSKGPIYVYTTKAYVRRVVSADYDTMPFAGVDTILVAHPTPQGGVDTTEFHAPVWKFRIDDSTAFSIDDGRVQEYHLPWTMHAWGYIKKYDLENRPLVIKLDPRIEKNITLWKIGAIGFGIVTVALATKMIVD